SPLFLLSVLSVTLGALLRKYCYDTLGRYFTFEVSILPDHNLITTGPYAWVRHPSYTGMYAALLGVLGALGSRGSWVRECGVVPPLSSSLRGWSWMGPTDPTGDGVTRGGTGTEMAWALIEDEALRRRFGKEWEVYAKKVRWGMFPGVF
ncbi:ICMT-domain-containing protein, partial [Stereum hirsutum FP-91666 SS1]|uniref:ICMT-domain-containing protein n=1 Tax=Stereum hirsutum (strain FP-91666) TaxID=721885 RepID=UPI000444A53C